MNSLPSTAFKTKLLGREEKILQDAAENDVGFGEAESICDLAEGNKDLSKIRPQEFNQGWAYFILGEKYRLDLDILLPRDLCPIGQRLHKEAKRRREENLMTDVLFLLVKT